MGLAQDSWSCEGLGPLCTRRDKLQPWETEAAAHGGQRDNSHIEESMKTGVSEAMAANPGPVGLPVRQMNPLGL